MTERTPLDWSIENALMQMRSAKTPDSKMHWARILVEGKRKRGDYNEIVQPPVSDELVDAIARHEAQAAIMNLEGERHD